ncbi:uncharacterized protein BDZ99DRAFT_569268 [Mytilinidion resinicola]|uniref:BZIP domain-containing protein n=1 Tax=Mytilinidion resinicola TaxID=574789 RepID=A0A6A6YVS4_9PEZI|nr:uncharacterized protein BDZ99DRAFT_569268 [Mytilinidion resinicola]KAF2812619.1 hypothetical protein BDZ99DRAFT_569268 [Mytilinidion resinicola]
MDFPKMNHRADNTSSGGVRRKARYPRKLTEERRIQNREAQRTYRERQKKRVQELENLVAANAQTPSGPHSQYDSLPERVAEQEARAERAETEEAVETQPRPDSSTNVEQHAEESLAVEDPQSGLESLCPAMAHHFKSLPPDTTDTPEDPSRQLNGPKRFRCFDYVHLDPADQSEADDHPDEAPGSPTAREDAFDREEADRASHIYCSRVHDAAREQRSIDLSHYQQEPTDTPSSSTLPDTSDTALSALFTLFPLPQTPETTALIHTAISRKLGIQDLLLAGLRSLQDASQPQPPTPAPSTVSQTTTSSSLLPLFPSHHPTIRLTPYPAMTAYATNAAIIFPSVPLLASSGCPSPFHNSSITPEELPGVLASYAHIPPDLRPIATQLTVRHHPVIDLLPFPVMRERLLELVQGDKLEFAKLKRDLLANGMICWRGGSGFVEGGMPWEGRSWEAKGWFLKRWEWVVGGKEGEVWKGGVWWRGVQGEEV